MTLRELQGALYEIQKAHFPNGANETIDRKLLLAVGELTEAQNELRDGRGVLDLYFHEGYEEDDIEYAPADNKHALRLAAAGEKPEGFGIELADVLIRVINLMSDLGIDAEDMIRIKSAYNNTRPLMHGKKF